MKKSEIENIKEQDLEHLIKTLDRIEKNMKNQNKYRNIIPRAITNGVFVSFGATIIFAIVIIFLAKLIQASDQIPILNDIIDRTKIEEIVVENNNG
jgi:hypothetical protein